MAEELTIGQAADAVGLTPVALRHYDDIGLAHPTTRRSGQRRYTSDDLRRLRVITDCRQAGFSLTEIADLLDADNWAPLAQRKRQELCERIAQLNVAVDLIDRALACGCEHLEGCDLVGDDVDGVNHTRQTFPLHDVTRRLPR